MLKIPYTLWDLRMAMISLDESKFDEKKLKEVEDEFETPSNDKKDLNKQIADHHGISVEKLTDSPNYKVLCQEFQEHKIYQFVNILISKLEITEKEAWALVAHFLGILDQ